jgi:hypothetical protein
MHAYEARFGLLFDFFLDIWCYGFLEEKKMEFIFLWNFWNFGEKLFFFKELWGIAFFLFFTFICMLDTPLREFLVWND